MIKHLKPKSKKEIWKCTIKEIFFLALHPKKICSSGLILLIEMILFLCIGIMLIWGFKDILLTLLGVFLIVLAFVVIGFVLLTEAND